MKFLRTPDARFADLDGYPYMPNYCEIDDTEGGLLRMHYVDEGSTSGEVLLCLHGQPTWSYLYRRMIPLLTACGYRVIAPDLVGFGRSDKPTLRDDYTYARHVKWMASFVTKLDCDKVTLVCQDWGGLIGLRVLAQQPELFARVVVANTGLPDAHDMILEMAKPMRDLLAGTPVLPIVAVSDMLRKNETGAGFMYWIKHCAEYADFVISDVISLSSASGLTEAQKRAYDAPFPAEEYKQGARQFPALVPIFPDDVAVTDNRKAWEQLAQFNKPFLTSFTDNDPVTAGAHRRFQNTVPGAAGQQHRTIKGGGHFLQEETGEEFAKVILDFCSANPLSD